MEEPNKILAQLEDVTNERMNEFAKLGKEAKRMHAELDGIYSQMRDILKELQYVMPIVKEQNPEMTPLFDELLK